MIAWFPFRSSEATYDLSHLHPRRIEFVQAAKGDLPERRYQVQLIYGLHCFTRSPAPGEAIDPTWQYSDSREARIFCPRRYEFSKLLPGIVESLAARPCYHTEKGNFFVIELVDEVGITQQYEVYFTASRATERGVLNLYVQSAYVRDKAHLNRPQRKSIRLQVILYNTLHNKPIKAPPR